MNCESCRFRARYAADFRTVKNVLDIRLEQFEKKRRELKDLETAIAELRSEIKSMKKSLTQSDPEKPADTTK